jgi:hypothetical protein
MRNKTPTEFLEELKLKANNQLIELNKPFQLGRIYLTPESLLSELIKLIEQFQAEQKQVSDEQSTEDNK